ncbi:hypothetical protein SSX86_018421 [Deinandra increscens subsp. villosa]|uniref:RING-type E3 ubiquitin transferase n=1 Tax=Deinandra increscens subsp. villosa TaxID=3103831 RepID=A0AAP0CQP2_9ASTR
MRHRHLSNSFTRSGIGQHGSNHTPTEQSYFPTGRGVPQENGPFVGQMNHMPRHHNSEERANVSMRVQPYVPVPVDPYAHSSMTEARSLTPVEHTHCANYNAPIMHDVEANLPNHPTSNVVPLKRKRSGSIYSAGGSSSSSSHIPMEKPSVDYQSMPSYRSSLTINEDSSRNVRRRYRLDMEPSITRSHVPAPSSQFYHSAPVQHANGGQWNCVPPYAASSQRRISPPDMSANSRHEMNQVHIGGSSGDPFFSRLPSSSSSHGPSMREDHVNRSRRSESSYGNGSRYSHYAHGGTSSTDGLQTPSSFSSRNYSRHYTPGGWRGSYRSGRPRLAVETTESHDRMGHQQAIMMVDQAPFYGNSRNISDQYRDLRLDIDNMSYEELLNLGERIGNVSTGLSEDNMFKYLIERNYCGSEEEVSCPICLEEYKNGDKIGMMGKCGHDYHLDCIKKWLLMKKLCPICKTECSN